MRHYRLAFIGILYLVGCQSEPSESVNAAATPSTDQSYQAEYIPDPNSVSDGSTDDTLRVGDRSVVFFTPTPEELSSKFTEPELIKGLEQAVGDFQYYALLIKDSLEAREIPSEISNQTFFAINSDLGSQVFDRKKSDYLMGAILTDPGQEPKFIYGLHTHLSWWELITTYFDGAPANASELVEYFKPIQEDSLHIFSSHEKILDRFGNPLPAKFYQLFGNRVNQKSLERGMSIFAYHQFKINADQFGLICRVPSRYDESAIHLFIWDQSTQQVLDQLELAENLWHNDRITVKDSWLNRAEGLQIVQRKREAWREKDGQRKEADHISLFTISDSRFVDLPSQSLSKVVYRLHDWEQTQPKQSSIPVTKKDVYWVDSDFVMDPLELGPLSLGYLLGLQTETKISKEAVPNRHQPQQIDTLVTLSFDHSFFRFYQLPDKELFVAASIKNQKPLLKKGIKPGISKSFLAQQFTQASNEAWPDIIKIGDSQGGWVMTCYFEADTLNQITIESYID